MNSAVHNAVTVLYVEDEESDAYFMEEAFKSGAPEVQLRTVTDGQQALDYLAGRKGFEERRGNPVPAVVLLDLNLPDVPGFEVLRWMRQRAQYKRVPVVVLSSSSRGEDKLRSDELGADWYFEKPSRSKDFRYVVEEVKRRWLSPNAEASWDSGKPGEPSIRMRKLVQNRATKEFLTEKGKWTRNVRNAKVFATADEASVAIRKHEIQDVDLYYLFEEEVSGYDFTIFLR